MQATEQHAEIEDIPIRFNESAQRDDDREVLEAGAYRAVLKEFRTVEKPEWKIASELKRKPDKTPDDKQWLWLFQLTDEGFEDVEIADFTSRTFGTPDSSIQSTANVYAALLLGKDALDGSENMSTKQLIGRPIELYLTVSDNGKRNYVKAAKCRYIKPVQRPQRPTRPQAGTQATTTTPRIQLPNYPDDLDVDF